MNTKRMVLLGAFLLASASAWSQPAGNPGGYGPGMMRGYGGGYGPGMMGGYGGYGGYGGGYGPGMMGGYGGPYGPGMMGGYGYGMMGGYGPGWAPYLSDLNTQQRDKIAQIRKDFHDKQWALMGQMIDDYDGGGFYRDGHFDEQAARKAFDAREKLRRQMFENALQAQKQIDGVLTPQQRERLQNGVAGK